MKKGQNTSPDFSLLVSVNIKLYFNKYNQNMRGKLFIGNVVQ